MGRRADYSAAVAVERPDTVRRELRWMVEDLSPPTVRVRHAERMPLGTPYRKVAERVVELAEELGAGSQVVVDATGLGAPVVETLREMDVPGGVVAVTITGGGSASGAARDWWVPKGDLIGTVSVLLDQGRLKVPRGSAGAHALMRELLAMRRVGRKMEAGSGHDDLVLALALACWKAGRIDPPLYGSRALGGY